MKSQLKDCGIENYHTRQIFISRFNHTYSTTNVPSKLRITQNSRVLVNYFLGLFIFGRFKPKTIPQKPITISTSCVQTIYAVCFVQTFLGRNKYKGEIRDHHKTYRGLFDFCRNVFKVQIGLQQKINKTAVTTTKSSVGPFGGKRFAAGGRWPLPLINPRNPCPHLSIHRHIDLDC